MNKRKFKIGELYRVGLDSFGNRMTETGNVIRIRTIEYVNNKRMIRYQTIKPNGGGGDGMFYIYSNFANCLKKISSDIDREIQITFHDKTTVAKMKEYGKVVKLALQNVVLMIHIVHILVLCLPWLEYIFLTLVVIIKRYVFLILK